MIWNCHVGKKRKLETKSSEAGLTLIESLVAISVIGITAASIGPVVLISTATRVQSQRAEQALQVAEGEIDRVRQIVEQGFIDDGAGGSREYDATDLVIASTPAAIATSVDAAAPNAVGANFDASNYRLAREIDVNDDGTPDFAVQSYRLGDTERAVSGRPVVFEMGVRVYEYDAVDVNSANLENPPDGPARLGTAAGLGERDEKPLAILYTEIVKSDERQSLCEFFEYQGSAPTSLDCS